MRRCCVAGCPSNRAKPYVSVFQFPKSPGFRDLWLKRIGRPLLKVTENMGVCIKHFEKHYIVDRKEWKNEGGRRRLTVKPGAVPSIFHDEDVDSFSDDADETSKESPEVTTSMQGRTLRSPASDTSKNLDNKSGDSPSKKMQSSPTTDKPFITIIKPEDSRASGPACIEENIDDSNSCEMLNTISKPSSPKKANPNALPSPYKHFPTVTVCLKEEDRVNVQRELGKTVKRTASVSSSNSNGSNEVSKLQPKRRKVEKPAPTVIGKQNDCYCWVCHRENIALSCIACPRSYHHKCAGEYINSSDSSDWVCPECKRILTAENVDSRSTVLSEISLDKLCTLLRFSLNKMKHRAGVAFHQPVSLEHYPMYLHYVIHPMDFSLLEKNIMQKLYGCTEAFLADVKWILHNSCVFNGSQHPLSTNAKSLVKACDTDMQEIEVCPDCFMHSIVRNKYWFSEVCHKPHPLVWAKLKGFPYWPAKVVRIADGNVDARFFGAHDRAWVPLSQCYHLSKEMPTSSKPKKKGNYETALDELNVHVQLLIQKFGKFEYASYRTSFDPENKFLAYHGIDIDKIDKEETACDMSTAEASEMPVSPKENDSSANSVDESGNIQGKLNADSFNTDFQSKSSEEKPGLSVKSSTTNEKIDKKDTENKKETDKGTEPNSVSNQLKKMELALQRIKGYISTVDDDDENAPKQSESKESTATPKKDTDKDDSKKEDSGFVTGIIKPKTLPDIEIPTVSIEDDAEKEETPILDVNKKNDSFSLKLIETIASCKAKLGISGTSELLDKTSSADSDSVDEEDEEDEDEEEDEEDGEEQEDEEEEDHEVDGDGKKRRKKAKEANFSDEEGSDEMVSESEEESNSQSSDTDIEALDAVDDATKNDVEKEPNAHLEGAPVNNVEMEVGVEETLDGNQQRENMGATNEVRTPEKIKSIPDKGTENTECAQRHANEDFAVVDCVPFKSPSKFPYSNDSQTVSNLQTPEKNKSTPDLGIESTTCEQRPTNKDCSKDDCVLFKSPSKYPYSNGNQRVLNLQPNALTESSVASSDSVQISIEERITILQTNDIPPMDIDLAMGTVSSNAENPPSETSKMDEDDDIFICNSPPVRPPTPPLICLDDGTETEPENEEKSDLDLSPIKPDKQITRPIVAENIDKFSSVFGVAKLPTSARKSMKRIFKSVSSEEDSSDEELQVVATSHGMPLTGAKRTFNREKKSSSSLGELLNKSMEEIPSIGINHLGDTNKSREQVVMMDEPNSENSLANNIANFMNKESQSSIEETIQNSVSEPTNTLEEKEAEILRLKKKLSTLFSAVQLQHWKHSQEKAELRHNMNLIIMEMRASLEADKKQALETLSQTLEREKMRCIEEVKKKQWCAYCHQESRYACCWNTSYCTVACQKRHFGEHRSICTQMRKINSLEGTENKSKVPGSAVVNDGKENKKVLVLNVVPQGETSKAPGTNHKETIQQVSLSKIMSPKTPIQLVTSGSSSSSPTVQFVLAPAKPDSSSIPIQPKPIVINSESPDLAESQNISEVQDHNSIILSKNKTMEPSTEHQKKDEKIEETNLEDIYFPSPPKISFEGLDTAIPDDNINFDEIRDTSENYTSDTDQPTDDKIEESSAEEDMSISDIDDTDHELVSIGRGIEVLAKYLNKCLIYGKSAKRLTRCLVDVIFPDIKLLASCSAFGNKSNVTKLTRAALPARRVEAIIDFVLKRFPEASRSEIVLAINMKCKEARNIIGRSGADGNIKKTLFRRLLAKEQSLETNSGTESSTASLSKPPPTVTLLKKQNVNFVCVQNSTGPESATSNKSLLPKNTVSGPNILRCSPQILIRPKIGTTSVGPRLLVSTSTKLVREPNRSLLSPLVTSPKTGGKILLPLEMKKTTSTSSSESITNQNKASTQRPYIIIGSPASSASQSNISSSQRRSFPSTMRRK